MFPSECKPQRKLLLYQSGPIRQILTQVFGQRTQKFIKMCMNCPHLHLEETASGRSNFWILTLAVGNSQPRAWALWAAWPHPLGPSMTGRTNSCTEVSGFIQSQPHCQARKITSFLCGDLKSSHLFSRQRNPMKPLRSSFAVSQFMLL